MWKNVVERGRQQMTDNMAHAHCMLDTEVYKYTRRLCNTYCFFTATMVARSRLDFTLYVHCLSFPALTSVCALKSQNFTLLYEGKDEIWALMGYYAVCSDNFLTLEYGTDRLSRSIGKESSLYAEQYCSRAQISSTMWRKPEITPEEWCPQRHSRFCMPAASELTRGLSTGD